MSQSSDGEGLGLDLDAPQKPEWPPSEWELPLRKALDLPEGGQLHALQLREPTGSEWEMIMDHAVKTRRRFAISLIAGVPMKALAGVGIGDLVRGEEYLNGFFEVGARLGVS